MLCISLNYEKALKNNMCLFYFFLVSVLSKTYAIMLLFCHKFKIKTFNSLENFRASHIEAHFVTILHHEALPEVKKSCATVKVNLKISRFSHSIFSHTPFCKHFPALGFFNVVLMCKVNSLITRCVM